MLQNHTQSTEFVIHVFKESIVNDCDYKAFTHDLFKTVRMPRSVYDKAKKLNATHTSKHSFTLQKFSHNLLPYMFHYCECEKDSLVMLNSSLKAPKDPYSIVLSISKDCIVVCGSTYYCARCQT